MYYKVTIAPGKEKAPVWLGQEHGIDCRNLDGEQVADSPDAQGLIDAWDPLPEKKDGLMGALDRERQARVDRLADDRDRQLKTVQFVELLYLDRQQPDGLTAPQEQRQADLLGEWNTVAGIEAAAARMAAEIGALASVQEAAGFDVTDPARWA